MSSENALEYLSMGDPDAEHTLTAADRRRQRDAEAIKESVRQMLERNPPPPLSLETIRELNRIIGLPTPPHELMRWRVRLYCGHVCEMTAHVSRHDPRALSKRTCPECGLDPATIVAAKAVALMGTPAPPSTELDAPGVQSERREAMLRRLASLRAEVAEAEAELDRLSDE